MGRSLTSEQRAESKSIKHLEVFESDFKLEWMQNPWRDVAEAGDWLRSLEARLHPDLIHLNGYVHAALPWRAPKVVVGHSCVLSWWSAVKGEQAPESWARYRSKVTLGLQAADLVIAPSLAMMSALQQHYGPLQNTVVISNGRSPAQFPCAPKEGFIFASGRLWDEAKNVVAIQKAAPLVPWRIYVAGGNDHPDGGRVEFQNLKLLGYLSQPRLASWYARASIYVAAARYEPFGLSILEAALAKCALVLPDIPSLREIWGDAAVYVNQEDPAHIAQALNELIGNASLRQSRALQARARALHYSTDAMAAGYLKAYTTALQQEVPQRCA
jgi:glycosyltransferase involved in cell wall biosynthesis